VAARLIGRLSRQLPEGTDYFNIGHSNLTPRVLTAAEALKGRIAVFIHDVIPSDFPQFQRPETVRAFDVKLREVQAHADVIICNSAHTAERAQAIMGAWGAPPRAIVSHLGTDLADPEPAALPAGLPPGGPFFIPLGTIEPRKNHALLLDIWDALGNKAPYLVICGARGWANEAVFDRLDALQPGARVIEAPGLSDGAVAALMQQARGLLFPSFAEGYGLPAIEAAARGLPVVASDLPAFREVLGNIPVYAPPEGRYQWEKAIKDLTEQRQHTKAFTAPTWAAHIKTVLNML